MTTMNNTPDPFRALFIVVAFTVLVGFILSVAPKAKADSYIGFIVPEGSGFFHTSEDLLTKELCESMVEQQVNSLAEVEGVMSTGICVRRPEVLDVEKSHVQ